MSVREIRIRRGNSLRIRVPVYDRIETGGVLTLQPHAIAEGAVAAAAARLGGVSIPASTVAIASDRRALEVTFHRGLLPEGSGLIEVALREGETDAQSVLRRLIVEPSAFDHDA